MSLYPERGKYVCRFAFCGQTEEAMAHSSEEAYRLAVERMREMVTAALRLTDYLCGGWAA